MLPEFLDWRRRRLGPADVGSDMHCHLLPGVDDGVADELTGIALLERLAAMGYRGVILTPHIYPGVFNNDEELLRQRFAAFEPAARAAVPQICLQLAAEYFLDERLMGSLGAASDLLFLHEPSRSLLVEMARNTSPELFVRMLAVLNARKIRPVLAHVERYRFVVPEHAVSQVAPWREVGALVQINLGALIQYGSRGSEIARRLWKAGQVDLLGTDLHNPMGVADCQAAWKWLARRRGKFDPALQRSFMAPDGAALPAR